MQHPAIKFNGKYGGRGIYHKKKNECGIIAIVRFKKNAFVFFLAASKTASKNGGKKP